MILVVVRALWVHDISLHFFQILLDDDPVDMPDPFPKYETQGSKKLFIFRIPRFNNTVLIDPTANMDGVAGEPTTGGGGGDGGRQWLCPDALVKRLRFGFSSPCSYYVICFLSRKNWVKA